MIKKLLLLILIFPLIVFARPEKKYLQSPLPSLFASLYWEFTSACNWAATHGTTFQQIADDDCDNNNRVKSGYYNITNITCSDGSGNGCDGAYQRIRFSRLPAGTYIIKIPTQTAAGNCYYKLTDGSQISIARAYHDGNGMYYVTFYMTYDVDQNSEVVWNIETRDDATACYAINCDSISGQRCGFDVHFLPKKNENPNLLIFK